jgi:hypothetical protein
MFNAAAITSHDAYVATVAAPDEPLTAERITAHFRERPTLAETRALTALAEAIADQRVSRSMPILTPAEQSRLIQLADGCPDIAIPVLAAFGSGGDPERIIRWAHGQNHHAQGRSALLELARRSSLPGSEVTQVLDEVGFKGNLAEQRRAFADVRGWLRALAEIHGLPPDAVGRVMTFAASAAEAGKSGDAKQAQHILALLWSDFTPPEKQAFDRIWPHRKAPAPLIGIDEIEMLGLLTAHGYLPSDAERQILVDIAHPEPGGETRALHSPKTIATRPLT